MRSFRKRNELKFLILIRSIREKAKQVTIPGFDKIPIYEVGRFFFKGIVDGAITIRAASVAFSLTTGMFPAIIFLFTLIPMIPIKGFQSELLLLINSIVPETIYNVIFQTINDIINIPHGGLLSLGFVMALVFSTNGIVSLIGAFNNSVNNQETRKLWETYAVAIGLLILLVLILTIAITMIIFTETFMNFLVSKGFMNKDFTYYLIGIGKWLIILALFYFAYSSLYYFGPSRKSKWRFISAGGTLATILSILVTLAFGFYINNFAKYNALYGSIGTLPAVMLMVYLNCLAILIGFELNIGIVAARQKALENKEEDIKLISE